MAPPAADPHTPPALPYLAAYPAALQAQVAALAAAGGLAAWLRQRHPRAHGLRTDRALHAHVLALRADHLARAEPLSRVCYDSKLQLRQHALGTHTTVARVQGSRLKAKREIRVAALLRDAPQAFLDMVCAHELAHLKEREHNKAFYQLCCHLLPDYHQHEFELRVYLTHLDQAGAQPLWEPAKTPP